MKILGIAGVVPSRRVSNQEVIDLVEQHSRHGFSDDLTWMSRTMARMFHQNGVESRHWLAPGEAPMDLMENAFERALAQAGIARKDIDLLIYSSVTRGFTEPANSAFIAEALGLDCMNFDVVNACMGWVSSMDLVNDKMKAGAVRHAVIVNMEFFSIQEGPTNLRNYTLGSAGELAYRFPTFTMGDAVTVTVLGPEAPDNFKFTFAHRPHLAELCTIALPGWQHFCKPVDQWTVGPVDGTYRFASHGARLHSEAEAEGMAVVQRQRVPPSDIRHVFTHTASPKRWGAAAAVLGLGGKVHDIGRANGNVATASVPLGLADAFERGILKPGQFCLGWVVSAGMTFGAVTFAF
jgi:3-oxoacyl-[acyl-carrier-protein] synthase III